MEYHFEESYQKARKEHFCDFCANWIEPGHIYKRRVWVPRRGRFVILKEHSDPDCPPNYGELIALEMMREERAAMGVPIVLAVEERAVLKFGVDGSIVTEFEPHFVPRLACAAVREERYDPNEEEIPF